jgi:hypothetical protein
MAILACAAAAAFGSLFLFVRGCDVGVPGCGDEDVARYESPDATYVARVYVRDCGATTSGATHVTLTRRRKLLPALTTLVFVADGNHGIAPAGAANGPEVRVWWQNDHRLALQYHRNARVFTSATEVEGVKIDYRSFEQ